MNALAKENVGDKDLASIQKALQRRFDIDYVDAVKRQAGQDRARHRWQAAEHEL